MILSACRSTLFILIWITPPHTSGLAKLMVEDDLGRMSIAKDLDGAGTVTHQV